MHCGMDFFVFCNNSYVNVLRDIHSVYTMALHSCYITDCEIVYFLVLRRPVPICANSKLHTDTGTSKPRHYPRLYKKKYSSLGVATWLYIQMA